MESEMQILRFYLVGQNSSVDGFDELAHNDIFRGDSPQLNLSQILLPVPTTIGNFSPVRVLGVGSEALQ